MKACAVVAQIVAIEQGDFARAGDHASAQDGGQGAVDRLSGQAPPRTLQVGDEIGKIHIELVMRIEIVAGLGDGERYDTRRRRRSDGDELRQRWLVANHLADRSDALVTPLAGRRYGFQSVLTALALQGGDDFGHVGAQVAAG